MDVMRQPTLFDPQTKGSPVSDERLVLYALGDFQARGKVLAGRELPLDRLRGALRRAAESFGVEQLRDEHSVSILAALGAQVQRRHSFAAKHPFHIIVPADLAERAQRAYEEIAAEARAKN
jgi:hypothetical protein